MVSRGSRLLLMLALPALAAFVVYLPTLPGGFLSDDYGNLHLFHGAGVAETAARVGRTFLSGVGPPSNQYRPLTMASFAANALVFGADASSWRLVNLLLHSANAALVALLAFQLAGPDTRWARAASVAAGTAFAWFAPSVEAVAWVSARFDGMALFWMLVAACTFVASERWRDRYGMASLAATVLAFMSKESAAIGPALIAALAWVGRPREEGLVRGGARALASAFPWLAVAGAYFLFRAWIFGDPFRFYPGSSPGQALLSGKWLATLLATSDWLPLAVPEAGPRKVFVLAALLLGVGAVSAGLTRRSEGRVLGGIALALFAACAMLFSHAGWSGTGEGGRLLYAPSAIAALAVALPLRSPETRIRIASWLVAGVMLASGLLLTQAAVERRAQAGAQVRALIHALADTADALPAGSFAFVIVPDHLGSIPFARNGQGGLMVPPIQARSLDRQLVVQLAIDLPQWPDLLARNTIGRMKAEGLSEFAAPPAAEGSALVPTYPDRYFCWNARKSALVELGLSLEPGLRNWDAEWARALDEAGCRE